MLYNEPGASKSNTSTLLLFCLVEKKISEKCCWLGVGAKRTDDQNTNTSKRASIYLRYILYRTRHGFGLFVCLFPGSRMSGTNRLPRNYYIHLKS
jgi:hypothetical protein